MSSFSISAGYTYSDNKKQKHIHLKKKKTSGHSNSISTHNTSNPGQERTDVYKATKDNSFRKYYHISSDSRDSNMKRQEFRKAITYLK